jgi:hypothetical protein
MLITAMLVELVVAVKSRTAEFAWWMALESFLIDIWVSV